MARLSVELIRVNVQLVTWGLVEIQIQVWPVSGGVQIYVSNQALADSNAVL
jgi:hypothetical protein